MGASVTDASRPFQLRIGVSACLLGEEVRYDGGHKRNAFLVDVLGPFAEWVPVCPEAEAGFGTPRPAMHLEGHGDRTGSNQLRLVTVRDGRDLTAPMRTLVARRVPQLAQLDLDGYVLKKDSPSCGLFRVKVYAADGSGATRNGRGLFADALCRAMPLLPVEEEGRLGDPRLRENFIERLFAYRRLRELTASRPRAADLIRFHTRHKLLLLAHAPRAYAELGRLVASGGADEPPRRAAPRAPLPKAVLAEYGAGFMGALTALATRGRHANVLQHMSGYFRRLVDEPSRRDLAESIADYQRGLVPLVVPVTLLAHYAKLHQVQYLLEQIYLQPHPKELMLRNHV